MLLYLISIFTLEMDNNQKVKNYNYGKAFAITGILCTTAGLTTYFLGGQLFYFGILFLLGMLFGFIGAFFILLSFRKPKE
ncbi:hypothetical protein [uncultured Croceitalea sp.]|uniref:hypothetical protein n=1 Tax=uncultured Croceitalea sp. TaxID=1798908 RepID=UPI003305F118